MKKKRIKDNPSFSKPIREVEQLLAVRAMMPYLKAFGMNIDQEVEQNFTELEAISEEMIKQANMPDRFNDHFASRGWIMYESMNADVAEVAIAKADANKMDEAEAILIDYYSVETVQMHLNRMKAVQAFRPRIRLAEKAVIDYQEERYHAVIPIVVALLDGMVCDVNQKRGIQSGFFSKDVDLEAWDSIAAHATGLARLHDVLCTSCKKTRTDTISMPYRHGIIHGIDLGYDTKLVAAKAWAALFAAREWALLVEQDRLDPKPEEPAPTWQDVFMLIKENEDHRRLLDAWEPRSVLPGEHFPVTDTHEEYEEGSPERKLVEFFHWWKQRNYGYMSGCIMKIAGANPKQVKDMYRDATLESFTITNVTDVAAALTEIIVNLEMVYQGEPRKGFVQIGLICQDDSGNPSVRGTAGSKWWVQNWGHPISCV